MKKEEEVPLLTSTHLNVLRACVREIRDEIERRVKELVLSAQ